MKDLIALAYGLSQVGTNAQEYHEAFCKELGKELLHIENTNIIKDLSCAVDVKEKQYVVTLKIDILADVVNT